VSPRRTAYACAEKKQSRDHGAVKKSRILLEAWGRARWCSSGPSETARKRNDRRVGIAGRGRQKPVIDKLLGRPRQGAGRMLGESQRGVSRGADNQGSARRAVPFGRVFSTDPLRQRNWERREGALAPPRERGRAHAGLSRCRRAACRTVLFILGADDKRHQARTGRAFRTSMSIRPSTWGVAGRREGYVTNPRPVRI